MLRISGQQMRRPVMGVLELVGHVEVCGEEGLMLL